MIWFQGHAQGLMVARVAAETNGGSEQYEWKLANTSMTVNGAQHEEATTILHWYIPG